MAVVVFECPIDEETISSIQELRGLRLEVLKRQMREIDRIVDTLTEQGTLSKHERQPYREIIFEELCLKHDEIEKRTHSPDTVYFDEIELYIDVLQARTC